MSLLSASYAASADYTLYYYDLSGVNPDGVIQADEYATTFTLKAGTLQLSIAWAHNSTHLAVGVSGGFAGWVGFGMNSVGNGMAGADMIIASISGGTLDIADYAGTGYVAPSLDDDQMPIVAGGKEEDSTTTVEFIIPLSSDDAAGQDHTWKEGETYSFFFAYQKSDDGVRDSIKQHTAHTQVLTVLVAGSDVPLPEDRNVASSSGIDETDAEKMISAAVLVSAFALAIAVIWKNTKLT